MVFIKKKKNIQIILRKTHNKTKFLGKKFYYINNFFYKNIFINIGKVPKRTCKWLKRRLAKRGLILNYRSVFFNDLEKSFYKFKDMLMQDPLLYLFHRFKYPLFLSLDYFKLTDYHLELIRRLARKLCGKRVFIRLNIKAQKILLKRTNQVRMGGGKGIKFYKKIYFLYPGCPFLEIRGVKSRLILLLYRKLRYKLPFKFMFRNINKI